MVAHTAVLYAHDSCEVRALSGRSGTLEAAEVEDGWWSLERRLSVSQTTNTLNKEISYPPHTIQKNLLPPPGARVTDCAF